MSVFFYRLFLFFKNAYLLQRRKTFYVSVLFKYGVREKGVFSRWEAGCPSPGPGARVGVGHASSAGGRGPACGGGGEGRPCAPVCLSPAFAISARTVVNTVALACGLILLLPFSERPYFYTFRNRCKTPVKNYNGVLIRDTLNL